MHRSAWSHLWSFLVHLHSLLVQLEKLLKEAVDGVSVAINPEKVRGSHLPPCLASAVATHKLFIGLTSLPWRTVPRPVPQTTLSMLRASIARSINAFRLRFVMP